MNKKIKFHEDYYYYNIVRKNIKKYRKMKNITQQELADIVEVSMHYISQIESGNPHKFFTLVLLGRIADALEVPIVKFFQEI